VQVDLLLPSITGMNCMMRITGKARVIRVDQPASDAWIRGFAVVTDDLNQWGLVNVESESEMAVAATASRH
jgi:hypothetical protein